MSESVTESGIPHPEIVAPQEWRARRVAHLKREKALTQELDRLRAERRHLPMVRVGESYRFEGPEGPVSLPQLFQGKRQLIVYHFMFAPEWEQGCPGCTAFMHDLGRLALLGERDTRFVAVSRAPLKKLEAYRDKHGWLFPWYSSFGTRFNYDFHSSLDAAVTPVEYNYKPTGKHGDFPAEDKGERPGFSVFFRLGEEVFHTYSTYARGAESLLDSYALLDITPYGRQQDFEDSPPGWPQKPTYG